MFKRWQLLALSFLLATVAGIITYFQNAQTINLLIFDFSQKLNHVEQKADIVIIEIDDKSLNELGRWPWPRFIHGQLIKILNNTGARAIAYDVIFVHEDKTDKQSDAALSKALENSIPVVLPVYIEHNSTSGQIIEVLDTSFVKPSTHVGHIHVDQDTDGVTRRVFLKEGVGDAYWPHFSYALYSATHQHPAPLTGSRPPRKILSSPSPFTIRRDYLNYIPLDSANQSIFVSFTDVINERIDMSVFKGKYVFVGATATGLGDILATSLGSMSGVEVNTWIFQAIMNNQFINTPQKSVSSFINFFLTFCITLLLSRLTPKWFLLSTIGTLSVSLALVILLQNVVGIWLPIAGFLLSLIIFYPLWNWQRLELALAFMKTEMRILKQQGLNVDEINHSLINDKKRDLDALAVHLQQIGLVKNFTITRLHDDVTLDNISNNSNANKRQIFIDINSDYITIDTVSHQFIGTINSAYLINPETYKHLNILMEQYFSYDKSNTSTKESGTELISTLVSKLIRIKKNDNANKNLIKKSLSNLKDAILVSDMFGHILFVNDAFYSLMRPDQSFTLTLFNALNLTSPNSEHKWPSLISQLSFNDSSLSLEATHKHLDKDFYVQLSSEKIYNDFCDTVVVTFTEITQIKQSEKARTEALNFLSHDLRSPMLSVLSMIELNKNSENESVLNSIAVLVKKNLHYADSFLNLSRAKTMQQSHFHICDMHAVFDSAHDHALAMGKSKEIQIIAEKIQDDAWVVGDNDLLERAVNNLVSNAIKYSPNKNKVILRLLKKRHIESSTSHVVIEIEDFGEGIAPESINLLFDRFVRAKDQHGRQGSGLGLHFVKTVANRHAGEISVTSQKHSGSVFTLSLPEYIDPSH